MSPKTRPLFKASPTVVKDPIFKSRLEREFREWLKVKEALGIMSSWEYTVKPGVQRILIQRGKEINKERRGSLNLLLIRQAYLVMKLHQGHFEKLKEHKEVQLLINAWYHEENQKLKTQSKIEDVNEDESVRIFHHELHRKTHSQVINTQTCIIRQ